MSSGASSLASAWPPQPPALERMASHWLLALPGAWLSQERLRNPRDTAADARSRLLKLILSPVWPWQAHKKLFMWKFLAHTCGKQKPGDLVSSAREQASPL